MPEKESEFTVTDRRKFTLEGDLRDTANATPESGRAVPAEPQAGSSAPQAAASEQPTTQAPAAKPTPVRPPQAAPAQASQAKGEGARPTQPLDSATEESTRQHYHATTRQIDEFLHQANPGEAAEPANFGRLVQSLYVTAMIQLGAGGDPNEEARVDLMGARESIDMMGVLAEKTKGNLTEDEQHLLQNALFGLRMAFLETANAIASAAQKKPGKTR